MTNSIIKHTFFNVVAIASMFYLPCVAAAEQAPFPVLGEFNFGWGSSSLTGDAFGTAQGELKAALLCGPDDPNDLLRWDGTILPGTVLSWHLGGQELCVLEVIEHHDVCETRVEEEDWSFSVAHVWLERLAYQAEAYLLILQNESLDGGVALPIPVSSWCAFFGILTIEPMGDLRPLTSGRDLSSCEQDTVDVCDDWYPPCDPPSGAGGVRGCAEQAACDVAVCHNLACIDIYHECHCEDGYAHWWCWWVDCRDGPRLQHNTCNLVYVMDIIKCIPKDVFGS